MQSNGKPCPKAAPRRLIAVAGGIGCGKSTVCRVLRTMGYKVYDCDSQAREIMDNDPTIISSIGRTIGPHCLCGDGKAINRKALAATVFADTDRLNALNAIVHGAVRSHLAQWVDKHSSVENNDVCARLPLFVETAILYQSRIDTMVDEVWQVTAPEALRIERVMTRSNLSAAEVKARIDSQAYASDTARPHPSVHTILNDGICPLLPQIEKLLG